MTIAARAWTVSGTAAARRAFVSSQDGRVTHTKNPPRGFVRAAEALGMSTTAEGIETVELATTLAALGCASGQGFYFAKPLEPEAAKRMTGYLPDRPHLYDKLTGLEYLCFVGELFGLSRHDAKDRGLALLDDMRSRVTPRTKCVILCTPHNPAATIVRRRPTRSARAPHANFPMAPPMRSNTRSTPPTRRTPADMAIIAPLSTRTGSSGRSPKSSPSGLSQLCSRIAFTSASPMP